MANWRFVRVLMSHSWPAPESRQVRARGLRSAHECSRPRWSCPRPVGAAARGCSHTRAHTPPPGPRLRQRDRGTRRSSTLDSACTRRSWPFPRAIGRCRTQATTPICVERHVSSEARDGRPSPTDVRRRTPVAPSAQGNLSSRGSGASADPSPHPSSSSSRSAWRPLRNCSNVAATGTIPGSEPSV